MGKNTRKLIKNAHPPQNFSSFQTALTEGKGRVPKDSKDSGKQRGGKEEGEIKDSGQAMQIQHHNNTSGTTNTPSDLTRGEDEVGTDTKDSGRKTWGEGVEEVKHRGERREGGIVKASGEYVLTMNQHFTQVHLYILFTQGYEGSYGYLGY